MIEPLASALLTTGLTAEGLFRSILPWALALVGMAVLGALVIWVFRRAVQAGDSGTTQNFTLQNLRDLRDQGELSEEEFQRAREAMIGQIRGTKTDPAQPKPPDESNSSETSEAESKPRRDDQN